MQALFTLLHKKGINPELIEVYGVGQDGIDAKLWAIEMNLEMIWNPLLSECGRFDCLPGYYDLTEDEANELIAANRNIVHDCI